MIYKQFKDKQLSALGMGCMRLPGGIGNSEIIESETARMVEYAIKNGVNYFDTAWGYHKGNSEIVMGKVLHQYPRESFYLATKFPGYDSNNWDKVEEIFEKQLEKCQVEYFDFYLFHSLTEENIDAYLDDEKYHIMSYLKKQKELGRIKHLGFSAHASLEVMKRFLDAYHEELEFCQIQLNYLDWDFQLAKEKVKLISSYGLPVWVMEPVRGGKLANLEEKHALKLKQAREDEKIVAWAFRFIQSIPEVVVTLSGMSDEAQMKENIAIFSEEKPLNDEEKALIQSIADEMMDNMKIPCTGCSYCTTHCPRQLSIPKLIEIYNKNHTENETISDDAFDGLVHPNECIQCHSCEHVCPQQIKIADIMKQMKDND